MWGGSVASIPAEWQLCDGTNGTVDLRNKFVVAAGDTYAVDDSAGSDSVVLAENQMPSHTHTIGNHTHSVSHSHTGTTNSSGDHTHPYNYSGTSHSGAGAIVKGGLNVPTGTGATSSSGSHTHTFITDIANPTTSSDGATSTSSTGGVVALDNRPAYYALAYIQKV